MGSGPASGRTIVAAQVAVSVLLLASATLFVRSLNGVLDERRRRSPGARDAADAEAGGYEDERAVTYYQQLLERRAACQASLAASLSKYPPLSGGDGAWTQNVGVDGGLRARPPASYFNTVSSDYFRTTGMTAARPRYRGNRQRRPCRLRW